MWLSKLQIEIALSTCEAKYIALSMSMHSLLPLQMLLHGISSTFVTQTPHPTLTHCVGRARCNVITKELQSYIYEDNQGALKIANQDAKYQPPYKAYCHQMAPLSRSDTFQHHHSQEDRNCSAECRSVDKSASAKII
jgi:hypothetical protein